MSTKQSFSIIVLMTLFVSSCGDQDLTRDEAKSLILASEQTKLLGRVAVYHPADGSSRTLRFVDRGDSKSQNSLNVPDDYAVFQLVEEVDVSIDITGVKKPTEGSNSRVVSFKWGQEGLHIAVKNAGYGGMGEAVIQLYDDGWRLETLQPIVSTYKYELTPPELVELEKLEEDERQRQLALRKKLEQQREEKLMRYSQAIRDTDPIKIYDFDYVTKYSGSASYSVKISSTYIYYYSISGRPTDANRYVKADRRVPFANVKNISDSFAYSGNNKTKMIEISLFCTYSYPEIENWGVERMKKFYATVENSQAESALNALKGAFSSWLQKHGEFHGIEWQKEVYGRTCN